MKKLSIILSLFSIGLVLSSCRQSSFIAEDDVYSTGSSYVYSADKSDASYESYVYTKESSSGTKSAYYNPEDSTYREDQYYDNQSGTVINNYYYGNDYIYNNGWYGYGAYGYPVRYRPYSVWWGWGYDPFFYSPWHYSGYYGWGMYYGWGYPHYGWGYNPYAWGYGYGYNPYGWGYGYGGYGCGNTVIYGNVYNYGGSGMVTQTGGGYYKSGNNYIGKRPVMAGNSAPYTGPSKVKSAINNVSGKPIAVDKVSTKKTVASGQQTGASFSSSTNTNQISTHQLTSNSKPWVPETTNTAERNTDSPREVKDIRNVEKPEVQSTSGRVETNENVNRPNVPNAGRVETPAATRENSTTQPRENNNQWNRGTTPSERTTSPSNQRSEPASRPQNNTRYESSPRGGGSTYNSSPSPSPSRGSVSGGSSPSRGSSGGGNTGGGSRGGGSNRP